MKSLKKAFLVFFTFLLFSPNFVEAQVESINKPHIIVYVFLHESCRISQYYTPILRELHEEYVNDHLQFIGLFPNFSSKPSLSEKEKIK